MKTIKNFKNLSWCKILLLFEELFVKTDYEKGGREGRRKDEQSVEK